MKALSFGEVLWDIYPNERFIGGAPFNFAAHLAKHKVEVCMLSALGNDRLGEETRAVIRQMGICDRFVAVAENKPTGQCLVSLGENGVPRYDLRRNVAYDRIAWEGTEEAFDLLYFGSLALRSEYNLCTLKTLLSEKAFGEIFVDVNIRPPFYTKETVAFCVENATILKISAEELPLVMNQLESEWDGSCTNAAAVLAQGYGNLKLILLTLGENGACVYDCQTGRSCSCPAQPVRAVSTVGAGDSFSAAFVCQYMRGKDLAGCLDYASRLAAFVVSGPEAIPAYSPEDI